MGSQLGQLRFQVGGVVVLEAPACGACELDPLEDGIVDELVVQDEIAGLRLASLEAPPAREVLVIDTGEDAGLSGYRGALERAGAAASLERIPDPQARRGDELVLQAVPNAILERIASWLDEGGA